MDIIKLSIHRPVFAWILMSALIIFGGISFLRLGISQMPDVDFPVLSISVTYEGASPEVIEAEILDKFEQRLTAIEGLKDIRSFARSGSGSLHLEFHIEKNIDVALQEVQTVIAQIRLPSAVLEAPIIRKSNPEEEPIIFMGFWSDHSLRELIELLDFNVLPGLQSLPGVGEVSIAGFSSRNLRIWVDVKKLTQFDFTIQDLVDSLTGQHIELPVGLIANTQKEVNSRLMGEAESVAEFENLPILRRGGKLVVDKIFKIKDFARVENGLSDIRRIAEVDGKNAVSIFLKKQRGVNEVVVAKGVRAHFEELKKRLPEGVSSRINIDYTRSTEAVVRSTLEKLALAILVTIVIVFLFLGSWSSCFNILLSVPTSIVGTFIVMYFAGFTLNLFSLLALALVVSIVIDDAIMVLENIVRHFRQGQSAYQASLEGTREVLGATIASTLAIVAVFVPVVFMDGVIGKFFYQFGVVMSVAVLLSLVDAVTITPMRASQILSQQKGVSSFEKKVDHVFKILADFYQKSLVLLLKAPLIIVSVGIMIFVTSLFLFKTVKKEFVPSQDQNFLLLSFQTALDASIEETYKKGQEIVSLVQTIPEVEGYFMSVGVGGHSTVANQGFVPLLLKDQSQRSLTHLEVLARIRETLKSVSGVRTQLRDVSTRGLSSGRSFPVSFSLRGPDLDLLEERAQKIIENLQSQGWAQDLETDFKKGIKEFQLIPKRELMAQRGVSMDALTRTLQVLVGGAVVGQFTDSGRRFDIRVKAEQGSINSPSDLTNLFVRNLAGNLESVKSLVDIKEVSTVQSINRINRQRALSVSGSVGSGFSQAQTLAKAEEIAKQVLPSGYHFVLEGSSSQLEEAFSSIGFALILGLLVAYMILAVQYNSFIHPFIVLMALPFALSGALLAIKISENSLNLFSLIGLIVLMGIAKKNSILLVEFINQTREKNRTWSLKEAVIQSCPIRLRPILMTSFATLIAALPLIFKKGMGHEPTESMAITIMGGILVSTILTLYVIPALYLLLSRLERPSEIKS
jgi:hydrophobe/amphiphile efflux-1 (HAE1) family protein